MEAHSDLDAFHRDLELDFAPSSLEEIVFDAERELRYERQQEANGRNRKPVRLNVWQLGDDDEDDDEAEESPERRRRRLQMEDDGYFEMFSVDRAN